MGGAVSMVYQHVSLAAFSKGQLDVSVVLQHHLHIPVQMLRLLIITCYVLSHLFFLNPKTFLSAHRFSTCRVYIASTLSLV